MFDYMFSADIFVADMGEQTRLLVDHLGIHPPSQRAIVTDSPEAHATMLRLHRSLDEAPTRLEIIQPAGTSGHWNVAHIQQAWHSQLNRPVRFHNTVVVCDVDALVDELSRRSIPHVVEGSLSFRRLFVGIDPGQIDVYDPTFDGGLRTEFLPFDDFPVKSPSATEEINEDVQRLVRVLSRSYLVDDLDQKLDVLEKTFDWQPVTDVDVLATDDVRRAVYSFRHERSAFLELLEPIAENSEAARFMADHGPGAYTTTFLATGISDWERRLSETGITGRRVQDHDSYGARLIIDPGPLGPIRAELVAIDPLTVAAST